MLVIAAVFTSWLPVVQKVPYLQDIEVISQTEQRDNLYDAKIMPKDLLTIVVSCTSPELAAPFNLTVASPSNLAAASTLATTQLYCKLIGR